MKIRNNKGFAITTVIYGLSIMGLLLVAILMATMSANRTNSRELSKSIEEELNYIDSSVNQFRADNNGNDNLNIPVAQEYTIEEGQSGFYKIELWGSQGAGETGGLGAYTSGIIYLNEGDTLYFYVGRHVATKGGRATEVRVVGGEYTDPNSYRTRIMVAAGGGTVPTASGGTLYGYNNNMNSIGGAIEIGFNDIIENDSFGIRSSSNTNGSLMGFKTNYARTGLNQYSVANNAYGPTYNGNGGDGYYASNDANAGGTSYISGYGGCETIGIQGFRYSDVAANRKYASTFYLQKATYDEENDVSSYTTYDNSKAYIFYDGRMVPGVNRADGKAVLTFLTGASDKNKIKKNTRFNNVTRITDCIAKSSSPGVPIRSIRIAAMENGIDLGTVINTTDSGNNYCATLSLSGGHNLDEIDVWHYTTQANVAPASRVGIDGRDAINHTLTVAKTDAASATIVTSNTTSETETVTGLRYSAFQQDYQEEIKDGIYFIVPVLSETDVLSAKATGAEDANVLEVEPITAAKRQQWQIQLITDPKIKNSNPSSPKEYKIIEQERYKALTITKDENKVGNEISANRYFDNYNRDEAQIWNITSLGDGTYEIKTPVKYTLTDHLNSGYLTVNTNSQSPKYQNYAMIGKYFKNTERYKLISVNYLDSSGK